MAGSWPSTLRRSREAPTARRRCAAAPAVIRYAYVVENLERSIDNHVERLGVGRYGFHHRAVTTDRFDEDLARYSRMGYDEAFSDVLPSGARAVHVDARRDLPVLSSSSSTPRRRSATTRTSTARQSTGTAVTR